MRSHPATHPTPEQLATVKHTSLPWSVTLGFSPPVRRGTQPAKYVGGATSIGIKLASPWCEGAWDDSDEAAANAEFIVRACNAHYELIEAAELLLTAIDMQADLGPTEQGLRAAIAKATGAA